MFFFKQKTAYEMRISDWSSDVCSSDLACHAEPAIALQREEPFIEALLRLVGRIGEFVEAVAQDQAAMRRKIAPFRTEIIDGLARRSRPAPPPVDELSKLRSLAASHDDRKSTRLNSSH